MLSNSNNIYLGKAVIAFNKPTVYAPCVLFDNNQEIKFILPNGSGYDTIIYNLTQPLTNDLKNEINEELDKLLQLANQQSTANKSNPLMSKIPSAYNGGGGNPPTYNPTPVIEMLRSYNDRGGNVVEIGAISQAKSNLAATEGDDRIKKVIEKILERCEKQNFQETPPNNFCYKKIDENGTFECGQKNTNGIGFKLPSVIFKLNPPPVVFQIRTESGIKDLRSYNNSSHDEILKIVNQLSSLFLAEIMKKIQDNTPSQLQQIVRQFVNRCSQKSLHNEPQNGQLCWEYMPISSNSGNYNFTSYGTMTILFREKPPKCIIVINATGYPLKKDLSDKEIKIIGDALNQALTKDSELNQNLDNPFDENINNNENNESFTFETNMQNNSNNQPDNPLKEAEVAAEKISDGTIKQKVKQLLRSCQQPVNNVNEGDLCYEISDFGNDIFFGKATIDSISNELCLSRPCFLHTIFQNKIWFLSKDLSTDLTLTSYLPNDLKNEINKELDNIIKKGNVIKKNNNNYYPSPQLIEPQKSGLNMRKEAENIMNEKVPNETFNEMVQATANNIFKENYGPQIINNNQNSAKEQLASTREKFSQFPQFPQF